METLTLERTGEFTIRTRGDHHCGTLPTLKVKYKMTCVCAKRLDVRGFLFDQLKVDEYFQKRLATSLSCEQLTILSMEDIVAAIQAENPRCEILESSLTLSPEPFMASMTFRTNEVKKGGKKTRKKNR